MSDGIGCVCAARSEYECCCDADWRPQELIDLQQQLASRDAEVAELVAALEAMLTHMGMDEDEWNKPTFNQARAALAKVRKP